MERINKFIRWMHYISDCSCGDHITRFLLAKFTTIVDITSYNWILHTDHDFDAFFLCSYLFSQEIYFLIIFTKDKVVHRTY